MSKTISINAGSSSLKWQLYLMPEEKVLAKGLLERIGLKDSISTVKFDGRSEKQVLDIADHTQAVKILLDDLKRFNIIESYDEITGVGHRVVAGGEYFKDSALVDEEVIQKVEELSLLAPLHNPANAAGIRAFREILPDITSVVVFDTSFHTTMPEKAYRYPIPTKYYTENKVRKYGAHGTSHEYVAKEAAKILGRPIEELKLITCHIGNGASITAVNKGVSVDTSMGFGPNEGMLMGTRCGDIDSAVVFFLGKKGLSNDEIAKIFNHESGMKGITGSSDARDVEALAEKGDHNGKLCLDMYAYRVKKYIGAYAAALNGVDTLIFTAGLGENSSVIREAICEDLEFLGIKIDKTKNKELNHPSDIVEVQAADSKVKIVLVATNEEIQIARDVLSLV